MARPSSLLRIDLDSPVPLYRQIVDAFRALLVSRKLQPGDQLPPVRQLAIDLGIHFNTVAEAYRTLAEEGWLDLKRRRGALVLDRAQPREAGPEAVTTFAQRLRELIAKVQTTGVPRKLIARELRRLAEGLEK